MSQMMRVSRRMFTPSKKNPQNQDFESRQFIDKEIGRTKWGDEAHVPCACQA